MEEYQKRQITMTGPECSKTKSGKHRKHTPIVTEAERGFFGAELQRKREGKQARTGMSEKQLVEHLKESKGKNLPKKRSRYQRSK